MDQIQDLLERSVADIIVREKLEADLRSGKRLRVKLGIDPT
ncbi:MAG TPA: tyrosine--tRNA ligase, partial [Firmicutes bacterium]|nr:tyrosine--tRNA ligase [Bacillota bacterium]HAZ20851.1 tyrosine--tRNA ligase [Bacillota bacterium]HBG45191.1 tyrosine--tRNA ligase [Bacillota bacterium]HBR23742.1 tyrosine--tRNA ligase [Bacillota bacterium]HCM18033.1 tyrosine--tRNA ligase [Bacillota bacterium]